MMWSKMVNKKMPIISVKLSGLYDAGNIDFGRAF